MGRWGLRILFVIVCIGVLIAVVYQPATAPQAGEIPVTAAQAGQAVQPAPPGIWYGLAASLVGAVVLWISVLIMARRHASDR